MDAGSQITPVHTFDIQKHPGGGYVDCHYFSCVQSHMLFNHIVPYDKNASVCVCMDIIKPFPSCGLCSLYGADIPAASFIFSWLEHPHFAEYFNWIWN